jgi:hypothetical protein
MRRGALPFALSLLLAAAACGPAEVVVTMEIDVQDPAGEGTVTRALSDIPVELLPYDRDAIFDSLEAAYPEPEPAIPAELVAARSEVQEAQQEWEELSRRWNTLRDTLQKLNTAMEQYSRGEARYVALFQEWQDFDDQYGGVEQEMEAAFDRFDSLQRGTIRASDSIRLIRQNWADEAFAGIGEVIQARLEAGGGEVAVDTTDASGVARELAVPPGQYWVHARYQMAYTELYWNVPITVEGGEPLMVRLTRENAQERPRL